MTADETRDGVALTNLDQPLFDGADATKRDLVEYLDAVRDRILPALEDRPLSVIRVHRGQEAFMQKNVPRYTPEWVRTVRLWSESSRRDVDYALCDDRRTLIWFANQRAVEYHPTLVRAARLESPTHLVIDIDPPDAGAALRVGGTGGASRSRGACRSAACRRGEDERIEGRPCVRAGRRPAVDGRRRRRDSRDRRAGDPPRPADRDDGLHEGGPRREGVHRRHARRMGIGHLGIQPAGAAGHARVVPGRLGRSRRRVAARVHHPLRRPAARRSRPVGRAAPGSAAAEPVAHRGGRVDPRWARAGDARGQTSRSRREEQATEFPTVASASLQHVVVSLGGIPPLV